MAKGLADREVHMANQCMIIDRGHFFLLHPTLPRFDAPIDLKKGLHRSGDWIFEETQAGLITPCDWRSVWRGAFSIECPEGEIVMQLPPPKMRWKAKIPSFLRLICPLLMEKGRVKGEFLSGRKIEGSRRIKIFIESEHPSPKRDTVCS